MSILLATLLAVQAAPAPQAAPTPVPGEKLKCRRVPVPGSRLGEKVCKTEAEWKADESGTGLVQGLNGAQMKPVGK